MKSEVVRLLNKDLEGEHAAIIQYLAHAYGIGEGAISCEIEAIAREEMRHMDFLTEVIVKLGGVPALERGKMRLSLGEAVTTWMRSDMVQEDEAILMYRDHVAAIADPAIKRLLQRILSDEEAHREKFFNMVEEVARDKVQSQASPSAGPTAKMLDWAIEHEYTVTLQYLHHSYLSTDDEVKQQLQDQAINEMQHMGWLAEAMIEHKGTPRLEHAGVDGSHDMREALRADIAVERQVTAEYTRLIEKVQGRKLKALLTRIRDHEAYHDHVFSDLLNGLKKKDRGDATCSPSPQPFLGAAVAGGGILAVAAHPLGAVGQFNN